MTGLELTLLIYPTAALALGGLVYWLASREDRPKRRHPAE